jgi:hypothetical protein
MGGGNPHELRYAQLRKLLDQKPKPRIIVGRGNGDGQLVPPRALLFVASNNDSPFIDADAESAVSVCVGHRRRSPDPQYLLQMPAGIWVYVHGGTMLGQVNQEVGLMSHHGLASSPLALAPLRLVGFLALNRGELT